MTTRFLPEGTFQAMEQGGETQTEHNSLTQLHRQGLEFWESEAAMFYRTERKELHGKRAPDICVRVHLTSLAAY